MKTNKRNVVLAVAVSSALAGGNALAGEGSAQKQERADNASASQSQQMNQNVEEATQDWSQKQKDSVKEMINKYGEPSGVMSSQVTWENPDGPWNDITIYRETVDHDFPVQHKDYLEQAILYDVPADKMDELAKFDGSVIVFQTKGRMAARCDKEGANILALNLAHDIINDEKSVEEARSAYADAIKRMKQGEKVAIMQELEFDPMTAERAAFRDETVVQR